MSEKLKSIKEEITDVKEQLSMQEMLVKALESKNKFMVFVIICLFIIIILQMGVIVYQYWNNSQYGVVENTEETTTEQNGVYNLYDSEGNMISSDLSLEEMQELIDLNGGVE